MSDATPAVVDDPPHDRFVLRQDGSEAQLVYRLFPGRLILVHTEVPDELGGRGIGGRLVQAAIHRAEASGETLIPRCPFARKWLEDHPDVAGGVTIDWTSVPS